MSELNFRYDINALRALAVVIVVLFHFFPTSFSGGFAGVDVFFVLSGYLMTAIVVKGVKSGSFSLSLFYISRIFRIFPALLVLVLVLLILGLFILDPNEYSLLAKHSASSVSFISNFVYWLESGYFDQDSRSKFLLHTWSLSVEWQFYIIYPLLLRFFLSKFSIFNVKKLILIIFLFLFVFSIYTSSNWSSLSYFMLPTRAWEMVAGSLLCFYPIKFTPTTNRFLFYTGSIGILVTTLIVDESSTWPGIVTLLPVLSTMLVLIAGYQSSVLVDNRVTFYLGQWSYSIYLWHWPVVVFIERYNLNIKYYFFGVIISVFFGFLSYRFIESYKISKPKSSFSFFVGNKPILLSLLLFFSSLVLYKYPPLVAFYPIPDSVVSSISKTPAPCFNNKALLIKDIQNCKISDGSKSLLLIGDSHANSLVPVLEDLSKDNDFSLYYIGMGGCPPIINSMTIRKDSSVCSHLNKLVLSLIEVEKFDYIVLASRWTYYSEGNYSGADMVYIGDPLGNSADKVQSQKNLVAGVGDFVERFYSDGMKVGLVLQVPMQKRLPISLYYDSFTDYKLSAERLRINSVSYKDHIDFQSATNLALLEELDDGKIVVIDPTSTFCDERYCPVGNNVHSYYFDEDHLSEQGASLLKTKFSDFLSE
ncbi:acyltransferase family protein [Litoribrevibacter euphylliae]|uniref:Acyltransferase family protein n=1 Tax=Litoribrevibacter euphylliae TaxID=1834034 RepID=A0ABV7HG39_9GAMM